MTALYLRLAGPLQSWAGPKITGNISQTRPLPTRSALEGLVGALIGSRRGELPTWLQDLDFAVRVDRKGRRIDEFQTIGTRDEDEVFQRRLITLLKGKQATGKDLAFIPDAQGINSIVNRTYLSDAEFILRIRNDQYLERIDHSAANPVFIPYLGRKAFSPSFPFYLGIGGDEDLANIPTYQLKVHKTKYNWGADSSDLVDTSHDAKKEIPNSIALPTYHIHQMDMTEREQITVPIAKTRQEWLEQTGALLRRRQPLAKE